MCKRSISISIIRHTESYILLNTAEWSRLGAGMLPPAVRLVHFAVDGSNNSISAIETGFNIFPPVGSVTLRVYVKPPVMMILPSGTKVAVC